MSASWPDSMRGPRAKTPRLHLLLLLLLLLNALTGTVLCQETEGEPEAIPEDGAVTEEPVVSEEAGNLEDPGDTGETQTEPPPIDSQTSASTTTPLVENGPADEATIDPEPGSGEESSTGDPPEEEALSPIIILIPVVLVVVIIGMIVCGIFINRRWNNKARSQELNKEDPYLDGSSTEKVPMPMFEEDVPSVLELEMEELDQWMKKEDETAEDSKVA